MTGHIKSICIDTFRGVRSLQLDNLLPINILTGDNNCGKTSVLEVLESFEDPGDFRCWRMLLRKENGPAAMGGSGTAKCKRISKSSVNYLKKCKVWC